MINLFYVLVFVFALSFVLIYFIASHDRRMKMRDLARHKNDPSGVTPDFRLFTKFCTDLCEYLKLEITDITRPEDDELVIRAQSANPITRVDYILVAFFTPRHLEVEVTKIMEVSDQIVSERLSKGIIVTTGQIPESVKSLPELAPMEFIDGARVEELKKKIIL